MEAEPEGRASSEEESSDDDKSWVEEVREQRRQLRLEDRDRRRRERKDADRNTVLLEPERNGRAAAAEGKRTSQPQFYQLKAGEEFRSFNDISRKQKLQKYVSRASVRVVSMPNSYVTSTAAVWILCTTVNFA